MAPTKRFRRSYNCGPCKKHKIKCDTKIPCSNCTKYKREDLCYKEPPNPPSKEQLFITTERRRKYLQKKANNLMNQYHYGTMEEGLGSSVVSPVSTAIPAASTTRIITANTANLIHNNTNTASEPPLKDENYQLDPIDNQVVNTYLNYDPTNNNNTLPNNNNIIITNNNNENINNNSNTTTSSVQQHKLANNTLPLLNKTHDNNAYSLPSFQPIPAINHHYAYPHPVSYIPADQPHQSLQKQHQHQHTVQQQPIFQNPNPFSGHNKQMMCAQQQEAPSVAPSNEIKWNIPVYQNTYMNQYPPPPSQTPVTAVPQIPHVPGQYPHPPLPPKPMGMNLPMGSMIPMGMPMGFRPFYERTMRGEGESQQQIQQQPVQQPMQYNYYTQTNVLNVDINTRNENESGFGDTSRKETDGT